jgi:hypothetical protein
MVRARPARSLVGHLPNELDEGIANLGARSICSSTASMTPRRTEAEVKGLSRLLPGVPVLEISSQALQDPLRNSENLSSFMRPCSAARCCSSAVSWRNRLPPARCGSRCCGSERQSTVHHACCRHPERADAPVDLFFQVAKSKHDAAKRLPKRLLLSDWRR